jgi:predicted transcriptional regulator
LLLLLRSRRTDEGWQLHDLLADGLSQVEAAERLGVTAQAVSQRARTAALRIEREARPALVRLLAEADVPSDVPADVTSDVASGVTA